MAEHAVAPGSLRYFAVLFAPADRRALLEGLYAFESELHRTTRATAHEVAHARLQWWRGEVDRLAAGRPTHPATTALLPLRERTDVDVAVLHEALVAADLDLARFTYRTGAELEAYCYRAAGVVQTLAAAALAGSRALSATERSFARTLGSGLRQAEMIRDFARDAAAGRLYLPLESCESAGIDPATLTRPDPPGPGPLLAVWRTRVAASLRDLPGLLPTQEERAAQRHGLVLGALHERLVSRGAASGDAEPGPLSRLWTAWRTAVRHA